jgi:hypothetical protein
MTGSAIDLGRNLAFDRCLALVANQHDVIEAAATRTCLASHDGTLKLAFDWRRFIGTDRSGLEREREAEAGTRHEEHRWTMNTHGPYENCTNHANSG